jgi:hypothetical protein
MDAPAGMRLMSLLAMRSHRTGAHQQVGTGGKVSGERSQGPSRPGAWSAQKTSLAHTCGSNFNRACGRDLDGPVSWRRSGRKTYRHPIQAASRRDLDAEKCAHGNGSEDGHRERRGLSLQRCRARRVRIGGSQPSTRQRGRGWGLRLCGTRIEGAGGHCTNKGRGGFDPSPVLRPSIAVKTSGIQARNVGERIDGDSRDYGCHGNSIPRTRGPGFPAPSWSHNIRVAGPRSPVRFCDRPCRRSTGKCPRCR